MSSARVEVVTEIETLYTAHGDRRYGEAVSLLQHSLLTAAAATKAGAAYELVAACLLHDIGHLIDKPGDCYGYHGHAERAGAYLGERFPPAVTEPVRLHVDAKRYLCAVEPRYRHLLSPASRYTLTQQGGVMMSQERVQFEAHAYFQDALRLRRWEDEYGKLRGVNAPPFSRHRKLLERLVVI